MTVTGKREVTGLQKRVRNPRAGLTGLQLSLVDIIADSAKQVFHDRYILGYDANDRAALGFNLSNSLQGAAQRHPLLVSPIPSDVLLNVKRVRQKNSRRAKRPRASLSLLQRSMKRRAGNAPGPKEKPSKSVGFFVAELLGRHDLAGREWDDLLKELRSLGLVENEGKFVVEGVKAELQTIWKTLPARKSCDFEMLWRGITEVAARNNEGRVREDSAYSQH